MKKTIRTMLDYCHFEGKIVKSDEAKLRLASHVIQYGSGCFGGIRGYFRNGKAGVFRMKDHFERIKNAAKIFGMENDLNLKVFEKAVADLIKANKPKTGFYLRPFIYSDDEVLTPKFPGLQFKLAIYMIELGDYLDTSRGLRLMVSSWKKFSDAAISTKAKACGSYLNSSLARSEAIRCGYDEALVMDDNWNIVEGSAENIAIVYRGEVIMPETGSSMLEGVTLRTVLDLLKAKKMPVRFERIDRSMIYTADEVLLFGTGAQVVFAHSVDDRLIGEKGEMGPVCKFLRKQYEEIIAMKHPKSKEWMTEFKY